MAGPKSLFEMVHRQKKIEPRVLEKKEFVYLQTYLLV